MFLTVSVTFNHAMKTKQSNRITAGLAVAFLTPVFALEAPVDDAPPPPQVRSAAAPLPEFKLPPNNPPAAQSLEAEKSETAFLGVVSGEIQEALADHLGLKKGEGIIVRSMAPNSPAMQSGIAINDVILAVAGRPVGSQQEISNQITTHRPGEKVSLDIIHKGKPAKVDVTLGVRPAGLAMGGLPGNDLMDLEHLPKEMADHIQDAIGGMDLKLGGASDDLPPQMEEAILELQKRLMGGRSLLDAQIVPPPPAAGIHAASSASFIMKDGDGSIEVKSKDGSKEVTLRDQDDQIVWSGPWDTEQQRAAAPENIRRRMESLNLDTGDTGSGLKFNFNRKAALDR